MVLQKKTLSSTNNAETLVIRLLISIVLIVTIFVLAAYGIQHFERHNTQATLDAQTNTVISAATSLIEHGSARNLNDPKAEAGSMRTIHLSLPPQTRYLCFGCKPTQNLTDTLIINDGAVLCSQIQGTSAETLWLNDHIKFRWADTSDSLFLPTNSQKGLLLTQPGEYTLTLELVSDHEDYLILVY